MDNEPDSISNYYADAKDAFPFAERVGGGARFKTFEEIQEKDGPIRAFVAQAADILASFGPEIGRKCKIRIAIFESLSPSYFAAGKKGSNDFLICISEAFFLDVAVTSSYLLNIKEIREFFKINDGKYSTKLGPDLVSIEEIDPESIRSNFPLSTPPAMDTMFFFFLHEISHIINGHIDLKFEEDSEFLIESEISVTSKSLEVDADCFATSNFSKIIMEISGFNRGLNPEKGRYVFGYITLIISIAFFNMNIESVLFETKMREGKTHPNPLVRFHLCMMSLMTNFPNFDPEDKEYMNVFFMVFSVFRRKSDEILKDIEENHFKDRMETQFNYIIEIERRWNDIRPILMNLKRRISDLAPTNSRI
jgi:hypothetical protein